MAQRDEQLQTALDRMVEAGQAHLDAVRAAAGAPDDERVWRAYIELNNAAQEYDELLNEAYGEVTPFDLEPITDEDDDTLHSTVVSLPAVLDAEDPHPRVVSVRQRRDYRVPSVAALLRVAQLGRPTPEEGGDCEPVRTVGEAVIELLQSGDGSLGMLDVPELEPLDGVVVVAEVGTALHGDVLGTVPEVESDQPFRLTDSDTVIARLHEPLPASPPAVP